MIFKLGQQVFEGTRPEIKEQVSEHLRYRNVDWKGAAFFGDVIAVVNPGDRVCVVVLDACDTSRGRFIIGKVVHEGDPDQLKRKVFKECNTLSVKFCGVVSYGGYQHTSKLESLESAKYVLAQHIEGQIPIEGHWNDRLFEGKIEDVRKELREYILSLPYTLTDCDIRVGNTYVRTWNIPTTTCYDLRDKVARILTDRAVAYMKNH